MTEIWGYHLMLDCRACDKTAIGTRVILESFLKELVERIDMTAYGQPMIEHFANHDPEKGGYTIVQLIETSSITGHFIDSNGNAYLDVFSCKKFEKADVIDVVKKFFNPQNIIDKDWYRTA